MLLGKDRIWKQHYQKHIFANKLILRLCKKVKMKTTRNSKLALVLKLNSDSKNIGIGPVCNRSQIQLLLQFKLPKNGLVEICVTGSENASFFHIFYRWRLLVNILCLRRLWPTSTLQIAKSMKNQSPCHDGLMVHFRRPSHPNNINKSSGHKAPPSNASRYSILRSKLLVVAS